MIKTLVALICIVICRSKMRKPRPAQRKRIEEGLQKFGSRVAEDWDLRAFVRALIAKLAPWGARQKNGFNFKEKADPIDYFSFAISL